LKNKSVDTVKNFYKCGRRIHNEELHNLYSSPSIIRMIKSL
jgi:hypothetical protein